MATTPKIILSASRDIPFNKLVLSQSNVRRLKAGVSIEELAEDIARRGLLQSLNVRPVLDAGGKETGMFEIPAGGRRYRALDLLVKQKRLAKTAPVPCVVRDADTDIPAEEDSLAENIQRAPLHPLDQFRAFQTLREKGAGEEEIAARFFVSVNVVKQRLRLASASEKLLDVYAEDGMTLDQLMAFTVSADHARQEQVWGALQQSWSKEPHQIRRMLTESTARVSDKRVQFVGVEAYEAAGGTVIRDLFQQDDGGWVEDVSLLERLVNDKLRTDAEVIAAEGWKWVMVAADFPYGHTHGLRERAGTPAEVSAEGQAALDALHAEYDRLSTEYEGADELPEAVDERMGEIEQALAALEDRQVTYNPADIARAGVLVSISADGSLSVDRGYIRPEDEAPADEETEGSSSDGDASDPVPSASLRNSIIIGGQAGPQDEDEDEGAIRPLPDRLVSELTAHRTLALRDAVAGNSHTALTLLLHRLCIDTFHQSHQPGCLEALVRHVQFPMQAPDLKDSPSAHAVAERHEAWSSDVPRDEAALWDWLHVLDETSRLALLAHCVSFGVNALHEKVDRYGAGPTAHGIQRRITQADRLARAVGLDMVDAGWRPTIDNYLGRVTKPRILEAVREAKGEQAAQLIDHLKKGKMAKEAERLLDGTGWLPEPLRLTEAEEFIGEPSGEAEDLPDFLNGDDEDALADAEDEQPLVIAAE